MAKSKLKIITNEEGSNKTKTINYSTTDLESVVVNYSIDGKPKVLLGVVTYGGTLPPEPPEDKPPTVEAGENMTVKEGTTVTLDGTAKDDGTITSAEWISPDGITLTNISEDELTAEFIAPLLQEGQDLLMLNFTLRVEDDKGNSASDQCIVTVIKDIVLPPNCPAGTHLDPITGVCIPDIVIPPPTTLLYDSNTTGKWLGNNRTVTDFDPLFPKPFVNGKGFSLNASGTNAKADIVDGILTLTANAGHKRIYIDSSNYNTYTIYELRFNDTIVRNHTMQKQSRHNHGGEIENKFGGLNHLTDLEEQKCGLKIELYHASNDPDSHIDGGKESLPFKISVGDWIFVKCTDQHIGNRKILSKTEYSKDGNTWELGIEKTYDLSDSKYDYVFNKDLYLQSSATWYRMNPNENGTKGFSIRNVRDFQL